MAERVFREKHTKYMSFFNIGIQQSECVFVVVYYILHTGLYCFVASQLLLISSLRAAKGLVRCRLLLLLDFSLLLYKHCLYVWGGAGYERY